MTERTRCSGFSAANIGQQVRLNGWVQTNRDHGGVIFLDIRDRYGLVQVVAHPDAPETHVLAHSLRQQDVVEVTGTVIARSPETVNAKLATGEVEVSVTELRELNRAKT
ncbi:MAG: OB-fold nucleic acid binding domain-containing protein, partial [Mariprofundaceae bacterium]|nr:OB-fold nucleic acid binding domain-containing protein [Mariprofundaceae bacterium]